MAGYVARRLAQAVVVLWAAFTVSFVVLYLVPGDPVELMASGGLESNGVDPALLARLRAQYGFDDPVPVQYLHRLVGALHGDLGASVTSGRPVTGLLAEALPSTLQLAGTALALGLVAGTALAVGAAASRAPWLRQALLSLPGLGVAAPTFWVGLLLLQLFSFRWRVFPAFGDGGGASLVLPALTLAVPVTALVAQVLARSLLGVLGQPYVETARAKGAGRWRTLSRHALRNAAVPALTVTGVLLGNLLAGSVVVETVFSRAGVGRATVEAVGTKDIPVVQGVVLLGAAVFVLANLVVDLVYPLVDPRIVLTGRPA